MALRESLMEMQSLLPVRHRACGRSYDHPSVTVSRQAWSRAVRRMATRCMQQKGTPSTPRELVDWARQRFYQEVSKPDQRITMAKACMLICLEEEAAAALHQDRLDIPRNLILSSTDPLLYAHRAHKSSRELGGASTWSLDRLNALAAEASALFQQRAWLGLPPRELQSQSVNLQPKPNRKGSLPGIMNARQPLDTAGVVVRSSKSTEGRKERAMNETVSTQTSNRKKGRGSKRRGLPRPKSASDSSVEQTAASQAQPPVEPRPAKQQRAHKVTKGNETSQGSSAVSSSNKANSNSRLASGSQHKGLHICAEGAPESKRGSAASRSLGAASVCQFPMHALTAINDVLFGRHGYRRMALHGDPRDSQLSQVMERGSGSTAALAILYMEVCQRMGLDMAARLLDGGRYVVLWPTDAPLRTCGQQFVVDAYQQGELYLLNEVAQMFELEGPTSEMLQPATKKDLLAALLAVLRDTSWAHAVHCPAEPGFMTPISCATALDPTRLSSEVSTSDMERALAAEERRSFLIPHCRETQERLALLYYFSAEYEDALADVNMMLQIDPDVTPELQLFRQKLLLWKALESTLD